ncbi:hypothetical protein Tco_1118462 [Tanacetum coccineum]
MLKKGRDLSVDFAGNRFKAVSFSAKLYISFNVRGDYRSARTLVFLGLARIPSASTLSTATASIVSTVSIIVSTVSIIDEVKVFTGLSTFSIKQHGMITRLWAGSRIRPPILATLRYAQGDLGSYFPAVSFLPATENSPAVPEQTTVETVLNMSPANKAHFESEKEAIHLILTRIGDEIYSTVDACKTAQEMWEAIERLQQGKEIAKPITPPSESASEKDSDPEQAQKDKDMQKNLALIAKYFKKLYKPTNNNLRTSSNTRNKNVDTTSRYKNDNQTGQFRNQRAVNVASGGK